MVDIGSLSLEVSYHTPNDMVLFVRQPPHQPQSEMNHIFSLFVVTNSYVLNMQVASSLCQLSKELLEAKRFNVLTE